MAAMATPSKFIDDQPVAAAIAAATQEAVGRLGDCFPELSGPLGQDLARRLAGFLEAHLTGAPPPGTEPFPRLAYGHDAFGDPFDLAGLPLPRAARGYAVQRLDTDTLLDRNSGDFLPVRDPRLDGLFPTFAAAYGAARQWVADQGADMETHPLAIVPAGYDDTLGRHILIYGVLTAQP